MYIAEEAFKKAGVQANIQYHTALPGRHTMQIYQPSFVLNLCAPVLFGVKKYADALWEVVNGR